MDPMALMDFLGFSVGEVERMALVLARLTGLFLAAPFFSRAIGPMRVRVTLLLAITLVIYPLVPPWPGEGGASAWELGTTAFVEALIGAIVGMLAHWVLVAVQVAGTIMGFEMGLSMAMVMDPTSGVQEGVLSNLLYMTSLMIFLAVNGHHWMLEGIARSFTSLPLGQGLPESAILYEAALQGFMRMFELSILIAAPVVVASKILYLGMGLINRASPQIQVFFVAMPIAQMMGFFIMGLTLAIFSQVMVREMEAFANLAFSVVNLR
ncbi:flagellar biosynthetic protein FliR [Magnetofaba australis]|uniref:Flagellar biosynthetic protein FliR n=1 Tax=Magnetofaba australis IT-1 TaxID=1434232 RepID=A0A1Y2K746_9PROT|nr:flagellar biosynthetic protein FliR [Magnetofaba australis]OSM06136.1 putative flagellar biosynthetic protein FliR [Magnetofaba australis IT-1]